jgi:HEAT repeat protein
LPAALRDLASAKETVRLGAARDLVRLSAGPERDAALAALRARLLEEPSEHVRAELALALADAGDEAAVPALVNALEDVSVRVRQYALLALGELGAGAQAQVREAFVGALQHAAPELRFQALIALEQSPHEDVIPYLVQGTRDADPQIRQIAVRLLEGRLVQHDAERDELAAESGGEGAGGEGPLAVRLRALLRDDAPRVRLAAAICLARLGDRSGTDTLIEAVLARGGPYEFEDEVSAVELVGELGLVGAREGLERRAFGGFGVSLDPTSFQARVALARFGDERAIRGILKGLGAWSRDARTLAVAAAGRARLARARALIASMRGDPGRADPDAVDEALARIDGASDAQRACQDAPPSTMA